MKSKYMKSKKIDSFNKASIVIALSIILGTITYAWTGPTQQAPNGNVAAPINVGSVLQEKIGGIRILGDSFFGTSSSPYSSFTIHGKGYSELTQNTDGSATLATKSYVDNHFPTCTANQFLTYDGTQLLCKNGGSSSCASENSEFKQDSSYTVPNGLIVLAVDALGGGGGASGSDTMYNGQGSGSGGFGGNSGVMRDSDGSVLVRANGGSGGSDRGDTCGGCAGANGNNGQAVTQLISVTPGEVLNVKIGGGGGGGAGDYVHFRGPNGGVGIHTGNFFENAETGGSWGGRGGYGNISTLKGGKGSDSGIDGNSPGPNGTSPSLSSGTGVGGIGSANTGGYGGDGGRVIIRTPTASELQVAGFSSACQ